MCRVGARRFLFHGTSGTVGRYDGMAWSGGSWRMEEMR